MELNQAVQACSDIQASPLSIVHGSLSARKGEVGLYGFKWTYYRGLPQNASIHPISYILS